MFFGIHVGPVKTTFAGIYIGKGTGMKNFKGYIDEVSISNSNSGLVSVLFDIMCVFVVIRYKGDKTIDVKLSAHDAFPESPSSGTLLE